MRKFSVFRRFRISSLAVVLVLTACASKNIVQAPNPCLR